MDFLIRIFERFSITKKEYRQLKRSFSTHLNIEEVIDEPTIRKSIQELCQTIETKVSLTEYNAKNGIYASTTGIAYMYYRLSKNPQFIESSKYNLQKALEFIKPGINAAAGARYRIKKLPSLILGNAGVFAVATAIHASNNSYDLALKYLNCFKKSGKRCKQIKITKRGSDELFIGRAGYVLASLWLAKELDIKLHLPDLYKICNIMVMSGFDYSKRKRCKIPLLYHYYLVEYLGAAHGLCTILLAFLMVPNYLETHSAYAENIKYAVDFLLHTQDSTGNFPVCLTDTESNNIVEWCHGAPGYIYLFARAYLLWKHNSYLDCCRKIADLVWSNGWVIKGPGLCHGISGNGYTFLVMYRLTNEKEYLDKAMVFANFMESELYKNESKVPENMYSLFEGMAGQVSFLGDLLEPAGAYFPFLDVFMSEKDSG